MSGEQLGINDPKVQNAEKQLLILEEWLSAMEAAQSSTEAQTAAWLATSLLKSSRRAYQHLRSGWQNDSSYVAWGCRNLLELRIFSKYVARSADDQKRFIGDAAVDSSASAVALFKLVDHIVPASDSLEQAKLALTQNVENIRSASGYSGKDHIVAKNLIAELGIGDENNAIYKLCSKLIHPTAQSILLIHKEDENQDERDALFVFGSNYLIELMNDLIPFMQVILQKANDQANSVQECPPKPS